jgi:hypothetical protein
MLYFATRHITISRIFNIRHSNRLNVSIDLVYSNRFNILIDLRHSNSAEEGLSEYSLGSIKK